MLIQCFDSLSQDQEYTKVAKNPFNIDEIVHFLYSVMMLCLLKSNKYIINLNRSSQQVVS